MSTLPQAPTMPSTLTRRRLFGCCGAIGAGLFTSLGASATHCAEPLPVHLRRHERVLAAFDGIDASALWDVHAHLLGNGDSGSGCRVHPHLEQWWHPVEHLRQRSVLGAACVETGAPSVDRAYVDRLVQLTQDFPAGARWLLFAFDQAIDEQGRERPDWTTFHVPDAHAARVAGQHPGRFDWVASIHPHRPDALPRLDTAVADGARALKWLPSAMAIDLRDPRLRPFYDRLARHGLPLIVHCGEEKAVPGAGRGELGNPLLVRAPLARGVRVIVAHCASLGDALDLDARHPVPRPAFELFARLMDETDGRQRLLGDISAVFQANRSPEVWKAVLANTRWHDRLLHGSDYPLPGVGWLHRPHAMQRAGLLSREAADLLQALRPHNPLLYDFVLKRELRLRGQGLPASVFETRRHFVPAPRAASA